MADIELVIKIPEKTYKDIQSLDWKNGERWYSEEWKAIHYGTPLPKGHWEHGKELCKEYRGRLLVDVTYADWHCSNCNYVIEGTVKPKWNYCPNCRTDMKPIIEADEESENT